MSYFKPTLVGFNESPPSDDGAQTAANRVDWSKHISKIGTPLRTYIDSVNNAAESAFLDVDPLPTSQWIPATYAGFSANPTVTFHYKKIGTVVNMRTGNTTFGTMNGSPIVFSTLPADLRPSETRTVTIPIFIQTASLGNLRADAQADITPAGLIEIFTPIAIPDGGNSYPRFLSTQISGRTFSIRNGAIFSYTI
jgi:hypothetical protein